MNPKIEYTNPAHSVPEKIRKTLDKSFSEQTQVYEKHTNPGCLNIKQKGYFQPRHPVWYHFKRDINSSPPCRKDLTGWSIGQQQGFSGWQWTRIGAGNRDRF